MTDRKAQTRATWLEVLARHRGSLDTPDSPACWSQRYDFASRDEIHAIQNEKLAALTPFLYENSAFYRRRFDRLDLTPADIQTVEDLPRWPVVTKEEMARDAQEHPPLGTYLTIGEAEWQDRGWMQFSSSGSTGAPRVFRYSHTDRLYWIWANARALYAMQIRRGDTVLPIGGFGPHVWLWGVLQALTEMKVAVIPGGGLDGPARARLVERFKPTVLACTPSYALYLGGVMKELGFDPARSSVRTLFMGGEPGVSVPATRQRLQTLWNAQVVEFYGCTEASPHVGGFSCPYATEGDESFAHLLEDVQIWETVDPVNATAVADGERGLTVCTSLNSESSPQLRFLVGDFTTINRSRCQCGRTHARAMGSFAGRADDLINLRGIKFFPSQVEEAVRRVPGTGDEFELVLSTQHDGLDVMIVRLEHPLWAEPRAVVVAVTDEIRSRCEIRASIEVLPPGSLPKTEFKARRVRDQRQKPSPPG
jgi:phenylacetate-CoA ligase